MDSNAPRAAVDALMMLELLAKGVPASEFDRLVDEARRSAPPAEEMQQLLRARDLALNVRALFARRQQRESGLAALVDTARDLTQPYELDALLKVIARRARQLLNLDMSWISFYDHEAGDGYVRTADGHATALTVGLRIPATAGAGSEARRSSAPLWTPDYLTDARIHHSEVLDEVVREEGLSALMAVPLRHNEAIFGVLYVADRQIRYFTPDEVALMSSLTDLASVAIERTQLLDQIHAQVTELEHGASQVRSDLSDAQRVAEAHLRLTDQMLGSADLGALVALAGDALDSAVCVRGTGGEELACFGQLPALDEAKVLRASIDARVSREPVRISGTPAGSGESGECWVLALGVNGDGLGTLLVTPHRPLTTGGRQLLRLTAGTASVALAMHRTAAIAESQVRDEFLDDLLSAPRQSTQQIQARARRIAVDLDRPHVVVVARPESGSPGRAAVWASSYAYRTGGLRSVRGGIIVLLLPGDDPSVAAKAVAQELAPLLDQPVTVAGAGPFSGVEGVHPTSAEALRCLDAQTALGAAGTSATARELGFLGVLLSESNDVVGYIRQTLGPVLDYDALRATNLIETLEAYFASGSSPTYAAELLHVHPNTVSRRLERISELLGPNWQKPTQALEIQLALRLERTKQSLTDPERTHAARPRRS
ncbi:helix-turn-helix domain-containing protein [Streptacidiphilus sp. N1-12]|uniref:Helix-turn-helix domain-containing protein n=2 Tax=Streptacidiphilus alkalitolerans TaxID=3342712 RepID=A0ABV6WTL9_9ACTN